MGHLIANQDILSSVPSSVADLMFDIGQGHFNFLYHGFPVCKLVIMTLCLKSTLRSMDENLQIRAALLLFIICFV